MTPSIFNIPRPDNIEISVVDYCNRKCHFCPHAYGYDGKGRRISLEDITTIAQQASNFLDGKKLIVLSGKWEPLLHPELPEILKMLKSYDLNIKIITNGDFLEEKYDEISNILDFNHQDYLDIDNYDGIEQYEERKQIYTAKNVMFFTHDIEEDTLFVNDRKLSCIKTNRAGSREPVYVDQPCFKLFSQLYILSTGQIWLCCEDWKYQLQFAHVSEIDFHDFWYSKIIKIKLELARGDRSVTKPCSECDCIHSAPWYKNYKKWKKLP